MADNRVGCPRQADPDRQPDVPGDGRVTPEGHRLSGTGEQHVAAAQSAAAISSPFTFPSILTESRSSHERSLM
jgi:hypothetical protein